VAPISGPGLETLNSNSIQFEVSLLARRLTSLCASCSQIVVKHPTSVIRLNSICFAF
jgi:hypothetical protein